MLHPSGASIRPMTRPYDARLSAGATLLRVAVASVFVIHGITRVANGTVGGFGGFLGSWGFPLGVALAWAITLTEIAGGVTLAIGWCVVPLASWFALQIAAGIVMVHAQNGWFVVGAGTGGVEYSALIIAALAATALMAPLGRRFGNSR